jgi:hypothetical protein
MGPSYSDRYHFNTCAPVWATLTAFGPAIRHEPLYSDALAVARETMRRVRSNIEVLLDRLPQIGYHFLDDGDQLLVYPAPTIMETSMLSNRPMASCLSLCEPGMNR